MDFCPGHNFQSIEASNFKLHPQIDRNKEKCSVQELLLIPFIIPPQKTFGG